MRKNFHLLFITLSLIGFIVLYVNFPRYEKLAEVRESFKDNKTGRWIFRVKFKDEPNLDYNYEYDKSKNSVLLIVYDEGKAIDSGVNYPTIEDGWSNLIQMGT